ncbi:MAG TPA: GYD domain-containing protein [Dehalococcoidia bacterium]|nr:GYD domain-containing protein [Dehalococcoidia bacterium]
MARYLLQAAYTSEAWAAQVKSPQNRVEAIRPAIEGLGGKIVDSYYTFGEYDIAVLIDMPDNVAAAAFAISVAAGGAVKAVRTTPLMTVDEGMSAVRKAGQSAYRPPS